MQALQSGTVEHVQKQVKQRCTGCAVDACTLDAFSKGVSADPTALFNHDSRCTRLSQPNQQLSTPKAVP
jgi:hypothetical protein